MIALRRPHPFFLEAAAISGKAFPLSSGWAFFHSRSWRTFHRSLDASILFYARILGELCPGGGSYVLPSD